MTSGLLLVLATLATPAAAPVDDYLARWAATFPTRALAAGRHDQAEHLEDLGPEVLAAWIELNRQTVAELDVRLAEPGLDEADRLDFELLRRRAALVAFDLGELRRAESWPLFWTGILSNATVFLLVRDEPPEAQRLADAAARARQIPALAMQARQALDRAAPDEVSAEICRIAARQARASAGFYRRGWRELAARQVEELSREMEEAGRIAAIALDGLALMIEGLAERATGTLRLGDRYAERFRRVTGIDTPVDEVLRRAESDLAAKLAETAAYGRGAWPRIFADRPPPVDDRRVVAELFARVEADRASNSDELVDDYQNLVRDSIDFVRRHEVITLPEPLTLFTGRSPSYFVGQSVGGVYAAGPFDPEAKTLFFLPMPSDEATPEQAATFFRAFNHHFNVMITPHEIVPGHYLQLKWAARHPRKVRALFGDGVYIEGWGTFCERLMLDLGWGEPLDRLAHYKKQLENIARTIVDIRVHTRGMERDEVLRFVQEEALQDPQFASNMWRRAITTSPQLTFYYLGYGQVRGLYDDVRRAQGEDFELRRFMDGMMELGPVPVRHYRRWMLGEEADGR